MKNHKNFGTASLLRASTLGLLFSGSILSAMAQNAPQTQIQAQPQSTTPAASPMSPDNSATYATGTPLEMQSKEGFWGHVNPFARKKWVARQVDPIRDRTNELDQLQAKNAKDIRDVDARATAGINKAMTTAQGADAHAADASNRADQANSLAVSADGRTAALNGTVSNLDQYQKVTSTSVSFAGGHTALGTRAKANLDDVATQLATEKGYIVEVQGYSKAGIANSQAMADSVVRYLVTAHQVPVYRIYRTGMGNAKQVATNDGDKPLANGVRVTVLHNSLATMGATPAPASASPSME